MNKYLLSLFILCFSCSSAFCLFAGNDIYPFKNDKQQKQFDVLTHQLRCLVCDNQTIADSNAPLALDLNKVIYNKILNGESSSSIVKYLTMRYGNYILYKPPFNVETLLLWFSPFVLVLSGLGLLFYRIRQGKS